MTDDDQQLHPGAGDSESGMTEPEADSSAPREPPPPTARAHSMLLPRLLLSGCVIFVLALGWLGYEWSQNRGELETLEQDLLAARDASAATSTKSDESGERSAAAALQARVREIIASPWWQRVVVRIVDAERVESARSQADELASQAQQREENRAWWRARLADVDAALARAERTIPSVMEASDAFADANEPHTGVGGISPDERNAAVQRFADDAAKLMGFQDASIAALDQAVAGIRGAATLAEHAERAAALDAPLPVDRNPPELEQAHANARNQAAEIRDFLTARDRLENEVRETKATLEAYDLNEGSQQAVAAIAERLDALALPDDTRFDTIRALASQGEDIAMVALDRLRERDAALAWIDARRAELDALASLDDLAAFVQRVEGNQPPSEVDRVAHAAQELVGRIALRKAALEEEQRLLEASLARAAQFEVGWTLAEGELAGGSPALAAEAIATLAPETPDQADRLASSRGQFAARARARVEQMIESARTSASWTEAATTVRSMLDSSAVATLAPTIADALAPLWAEAAMAEDHEIYLSLLGSAGAPRRELLPLAERYLDDARLRGATAPMRAEVERLLAALDTPGVTIQLEGVEWADPQCEWNSPQTHLGVTILEETFDFVLGEVSSRETSLLGGESWLRGESSTPVAFGVSGYFDCSDDDGIFAGSGALSMDDLACGGRLALPFWNDADQSLQPHLLLLVAIADAEVQEARALPAWKDPNAPVQDSSDQLLSPATSQPIDPTDPSNENAIKE